MSYEVDVLAPWLSERRFQSASPCSDPNPKHPSMASSFEGGHGQQIHTGRAIIWEQLHKTFSSSLLLGAFVCLFFVCFIILYLSPSLGLPAMSPRAQPNSDPFQTHTLSQRLPEVGRSSGWVAEQT